MGVLELEMQANHAGAIQLFQLECGGWLAVSGPDEPIKIGATEHETKDLYRHRQALWKELLAGYVPLEMDGGFAPCLTWRIFRRRQIRIGPITFTSTRAAFRPSGITPYMIRGFTISKQTRRIGYKSLQIRSLSWNIVHPN